MLGVQEPIRLITVSLDHQKIVLQGWPERQNGLSCGTRRCVVRLVDRQECVMLKKYSWLLLTLLLAACSSSPPPEQKPVRRQTTGVPKSHPLLPAELIGEDRQQQQALQAFIHSCPFLFLFFSRQMNELLTFITAAALVFGSQTGENQVKIKSLGGDLSVKFQSNPDGSFSKIWLIGPAEQVFSGKIDL